MMGKAERYFGPITRAHLRRLSKLAVADRDGFFVGHPEYRRRVLGVVLAQGAAQHYWEMKEGMAPKGVKDLDVWTFFAAIPGKRFPADRRETHADFGPSVLGRQRYSYRGISEDKRRRFAKWETYEGRRVDFLMRALPVRPSVDPVDAITDWLQRGASRSDRTRPSAWYLAQQAVVIIDPAERRGEISWTPRTP